MTSSCLCCSARITSLVFFFFSSRRRHTIFDCDWSSDVCSSDLLALDFANMVPARGELSWDQLIAFLQSAHIITAERGGELLALSRSDPQSAESLLRKAQRLASALRMAFEALLHRHRIVSEWVAPVNEILRVTEGHDELVPGDRDWKIEFVAREGGLEWLLAAVARSAAEMIAEGPRARLGPVANPRSGLLFFLPSRPARRRC